METAIDGQADTLSSVRRLPSLLKGSREVLLANLVMIGEIPAPTFDEGRRIDFLAQRFTECGLDNCSRDEVGNGLAMLPGTEGNRNILVTAHADTPFPCSVNHTLNVDIDRVTGPAVADNSLGLAVIATLPTLLERLQIRLRSNLVLMGAARSLGRGDLEGLRFFLANNELPITASIVIEGIQQGRLNYSSLASLGGEILCKTRIVGDADALVSRGAIRVLTQLIERLDSIPLPVESRTRLVLAAVEAGNAFNMPAKSALLRFHLDSESGEVLADIEQQIRTIVEEVATKNQAAITFEVISRTNAGGLTADHPFVVNTRRIMAALGIAPDSEPYSASISSFIEQGIPAVTVGISSGTNVSELDESAAIDPMLRGVAQVIGILLAVDGGCCE